MGFCGVFEEKREKEKERERKVKSADNKPPFATFWEATAGCEFDTTRDALSKDAIDQFKARQSTLEVEIGNQSCGTIQDNKSPFYPLDISPIATSSKSCTDLKRCRRVSWASSFKKRRWLHTFLSDAHVDLSSIRHRIPII